MTERVLKFSVPVDDQWHPVGGGPVVHVGCQDNAGVVAVWTREGHHHGHRRSRAVRAFGTGQPLPEGVEHIGTVITASGRLVWHLFASATEATSMNARCQHLSPSPWGTAQCALPLGHDERHAYSPSEGSGGEETQ